MPSVVTTGIGFFTEAYDVFIINLIFPMLEIIYSVKSAEGAIKSSAACGSLFGQVLFGYFSDYLGRKKMFTLVLIILIICTINSALSASSFSLHFATLFSIWRFLLGIGVGGEYPVSAVIASEMSSKKERGKTIGLVFSMQGLGILFGCLMSIFMLFCFRSLLEEDIQYLDYVWRILIGIGIIPALIASYWRNNLLIKFWKGLY